MNTNISTNDDDFDMWAEGADESRARAAAAKGRPDCISLSDDVIRKINEEADQGYSSAVVSVGSSNVPCVDDAIEHLEEAGYTVDWDADTRELSVSW